jgi:hypothetical protein
VRAVRSRLLARLDHLGRHADEAGGLVGGASALDGRGREAQGRRKDCDQERKTSSVMRATCTEPARASSFAILRATLRLDGCYRLTPSLLRTAAKPRAMPPQPRPRRLPPPLLHLLSPCCQVTTRATHHLGHTGGGHVQRGAVCEAGVAQQRLQRLVAEEEDGRCSRNGRSAQSRDAHSPAHGAQRQPARPAMHTRDGAALVRPATRQPRTCVVRPAARQPQRCVAPPSARALSPLPGRCPCCDAPAAPDDGTAWPTPFTPSTAPRPSPLTARRTAHGDTADATVGILEAAGGPEALARLEARLERVERVEEQVDAEAGERAAEQRRQQRRAQRCRGWRRRCGTHGAARGVWRSRSKSRAATAGRAGAHQPSRI